MDKYAKAKKEYYERNREALNELRSEWRKKNKKRVKETAKKYYSENREECLKRTADWRKENPDYQKKYYQANREKLLAKRRIERQKIKERLILKELQRFKKENKIKASKHLQEYYDN